LQLASALNVFMLKFTGSGAAITIFDIGSWKARDEDLLGRR
jgi:hypothetical protein